MNKELKMFELTSNRIFKDITQKTKQGKDLILLIPELEEKFNMNSLDVYTNFIGWLGQNDISTELTKVYGQYRIFDTYPYARALTSRTYTVNKKEWKEWSEGFLSEKRQLVDSTVFTHENNVIASYTFWSNI
jgi:hypothetical protein